MVLGKRTAAPGPATRAPAESGPAQASGPAAAAALARLSDEEFRTAIRDWLARNLAGEFAGLRGAGGPGREHEAFEERLAWDRHLSAAGWTTLSWPAEHGGRGATISQQMIFHEEYARADGPARVSHMGEQLLGPALIAFGAPEQQRRFLPAIASVTELWCQGFSEPGAGSDLASIATTARLAGDHWEVTGQKVWTSLAHVADWCFVLARTEPGSRRGRGLSMLLVPMRQPRVTVRPIRQLTGTSEFSEVFFDGARTDADLVLGEPGDGWKVARYLLGVERGAATFGQQIQFRREFDDIVAQVRRGRADPALREKIARAWVGLEVLRACALETLAAVERPEADAGAAASVMKLLWARWHKALGELAMEVAGARALVAGARPYELDAWQRLYLFSRADTIYGGSDEIQLGIIAGRALGLPREPTPAPGRAGRPG
ncbi:MAG TPA: acyl-CoA dehydrogenase family protein [Streptosporangiaceae bacterium]|nr:acyl-CoA dehydrogenase family protein [Streptosporangiaceae bacterium]